jgi:hypothetical protein
MSAEPGASPEPGAQSPPGVMSPDAPLRAPRGSRRSGQELAPPGSGLPASLRAPGLGLAPGSALMAFLRAPGSNLKAWSSP